MPSVSELLRIGSYVSLGLTAVFIISTFSNLLYADAPHGSESYDGVGYLVGGMFGSLFLAIVLHSLAGDDEEERTNNVIHVDFKRGRGE